MVQAKRARPGGSAAHGCLKHQLAMENSIALNGQIGSQVRSRCAPLVRRLMRTRKITGLSLAVVDATGPLFAEGYGFADLVARQPSTPQTVFKIGSITKVFTATAAMQLCERGLLDLDRPVVDYLPEFSMSCTAAELRQITPRRLMTHHSGLPADWQAGYWDDDPHAFRQVLAILRGRRLAFPPNTVFCYSNLGLSLLALVMERASGRTYQECVEQGILAPLGMTDSTMTGGQAAQERLAKAYAAGREADDPTLRDAPAGAIYSTATDMARFAAALLAGGAYPGGKLLRPETLAEMFRAQNECVPYDLGFRIGLNWLLGCPALAGAGRAVWHDGGTPHFFSMLLLLPDAQLGAVVLSNSDGGMVTVHTIAEALLREALAARAADSPPNGSRRPAQAASVAPAKAAPTPAGTFATVSGPVRIVGRGSRWHAFLQGQQFRLDPQPDGWYALRLLLLGLLPIKLAAVEGLRLGVFEVAGQRLLGLEQGGLQVPAGLEYEPVPIPQAWASAAGAYRLLTATRLPPFTAARLEVQADWLVLRATARKAGKLTFVLRPISEYECVTLGLGRFGGETLERVDTGGQPKLRLLGLELARQ
jgi:CubicO group peptidase (beta-lactamase class C family)